jgi:hypothetical protein
MQVDDEQVVFIGGVILRHITQLVCNASAIYQVPIKNIFFNFEKRSSLFRRERCKN